MSSPKTSSQAFWQGLYEEGQTAWDLGGPTPVFRRLLEEQRLPPGDMIVLGAGRGYDARLFAANRFAVTAVDFAPAAVRELHARNDTQNPVAVVQSDIFSLNPLLHGRFDYVLEYTFYCAIEPQRRADYASVVAQLLRPGGRFVGLAFPIEARQGGPPFAVDPDQLVSLLSARGLCLEQREAPPDTIAPRRGREELLILQKMAHSTPSCQATPPRQ